MAIDRIPLGLIPSSGSIAFTEGSIPDALQKEHKLAAGHWGVLHVFEGSLNFVDIGSGEQRSVSAPDLVTIHPEAPHRVEVERPVSCRVDFFREPYAGSSMSTPGAYAEEAVRARGVAPKLVGRTFGAASVGVKQMGTLQRPFTITSSTPRRR